MTTKKRKTQFNVILVLFPILILVVLEVSLRILGYGNKTKLFFIPKYVPELYLENLEGYNKYHDKENQIKTDKIENHIRNIMQTNKKTNGLRGFVIGESAAQGFPYNSNHSFSKMIEAAILKTGKYEEVEILNMGISAVSTYAMKDIAKKVLQYDPDFLVIYAGNNEYYGTFSYTTGGSHFTRNMYLELYELKLFQLMKGFISLFSGKEPKNLDKRSVMKERFKETVVLKDKKTDQKVAENYVKNMKAIVKLYQKKDIPVIVIQPVCNLLDMPPFKGENDDEIETLLVKTKSLIDSGSLQLADTVMYNLKNNYPGNANVLYLEAKIDRIRNGAINLEKFEEAKNFDIIPFRPRQELTDNLDKFCKEYQKSYKKLHYIPLKNKLTNIYGDSILGNRIFIDHVHFNQYGHKIAGELISYEVAQALYMNKSEIDSISAFFEDEDKVYQKIYSLPMYRLFANKLVSSLVDQPPFPEMVFPYEFDVTELNNAIDDMGLELAEITLPYDLSNSFSHTVVYYMKKEQYQLAHQYFMADRFLFPGSYHRYLNLGRFLRRFEEFLPDAEMSYIQAYLLSEKKKDIYKEIKGFYNETNQFAKAKEFDQKFGKPKN